MTVIGWIQILLYCAIVVALVKPLGWYMTRVFNGESTFLSPVLRPVERGLYWIGGVDEKREQHWLTYTVAMLLFHVGGFLIIYGLMRLQALLPLNPAEQSAVAPDLSFNTAISFLTNTNWQNYGGESTLSYLTQMVGLTHQNFLSAATGIALAVALIRGFSRSSMRTIGNFWVDVTRLHPLCAAADLHRLHAVPGLAGHAADAWRLRRGDDAGRRQADHRGRPRRLAGRDQDARHQWRRLLQRQCRASLRKPHRAVELRADDLDLRARRGDDQRVRPHGRQPAPGLGDPRRDGRAVPVRRRSHLLGRSQRYLDACFARPHRRQHGRQGSPLRHRRLLTLSPSSPRRPPAVPSTPCTTRSPRSAA